MGKLCLIVFRIAVPFPSYIHTAGYVQVCRELGAACCELGAASCERRVVSFERGAMRCDSRAEGCEP